MAFRMPLKSSNVGTFEKPVQQIDGQRHDFGFAVRPDEAIIGLDRACTHNGQIAAFYGPFTSVVQKIALAAIVDQVDNSNQRPLLREPRRGRRLGRG